ncbi:M16 family metallopeptidase [Pontimicrobium aquaticum]|uniref:Insulinase family protein n=1 Tax=Pontimicrobium aquaticum TaxID=2565367 RepID=A0A4U0F0B5_9FLAO|nr:M16 family metallopeptidase [Pontimicrobium aquaticum]TJY37835.1 insulinase family protein [Pontimicrobium aquaticum]
MKRILLQFFALACVFVVNAQSLNLNQPLPLDNTIKKGVLPNGMTYYLHSTDVTKDVASYYIIQNVGSVLENDDQQGLAHFLEHMAFNGTENFEGKGILNTLEKEGIVFGKDINAYTSFDETVYNIDNVPTTPELVETGLQILRDWSNYLLLTDEEIDAERGVIKEEWRTRQSGQMRILQQSIETMFGGSKYAKRIPIGNMDVIQNFEYKALRDFYHDWYRTDLQAIAIVGDIDVDDMEVKIKEKFSTIPAVENAPERFIVKIEDNDKLMYDIAMDKEVSTANISFGIRHDKSLENETVADLRIGLLNSMISSILGTRFREISQQPDAPFIAVGAGFGDMTRVHNAFNVRVAPKPEKQQEAFKLVMTEINRAVKFGFTNAEIKLVKAQFSSFYENQIAKRNDRPHGQIIQSIQKNYLENAHLTDIEKEFEIVKGLFSQITQADLLQRMQDIYTQKNRTLVVTGVEGKNNLTEEQANQIIKDAENDTTLQPYEEDEEAKSLMDGVNLVPGKIVEEKENSELGFTTFTLSNGIKVYYKFADKNKNDVKLEAISDGGKSLLKVDELPSAEIVSNVVQLSGLGEFSMTDLPKVLAGKTANTSFSIGETTEAIVGASSTKDVETMLQMVNLRFTKPRFDETSYKVLMQNIDNFLVRRSQDLNSKMSDSVTTTLYGHNHSTKRIFNKSFVADMSFEKSKAVYKSRFNNAADFTFFIVGDVKKEDVKPLLENYIASIPTTNVKENWVNNAVEWSAKNIDKDIYLPMEDPKGSVQMAIKKEMPFNLKDQLLMTALGKILQLRYNELLREDEGGTYGASSWGQVFKEPRSIAYLSVTFDCNPDLVEKLIGIVHAEIDKIKKGTVLQTDLDKVTTNLIKEREDSKNFNAYEMSLLKNLILEGYNMEAPENFKNIVKSITKNDIQDMVKRLLDNHKSFEIVFKPIE